MLTLAYLRPEEGQSIWPKRRQGFQPCFEAGIRELPFLVHNMFHDCVCSSAVFRTSSRMGQGKLDANGVRLDKGG